jgi:plastocyanin
VCYLSVLLVWISVMGWTTGVLAQQKEFYIATVHLDGKTSTKGDAAHPPEAFPTQSLPSGGGIVMRQPDAEGTWQIRAFVFQPAQLTVYQGDQVTLHFLGVQGPSHTITVACWCWGACSGGSAGRPRHSQTGWYGR